MDNYKLRNRPCQRCKKGKKGCDRERPCSRCKISGRTAAQCDEQKDLVQTHESSVGNPETSSFSSFLLEQQSSTFQSFSVGATAPVSPATTRNSHPDQERQTQQKQVPFEDFFLPSICPSDPLEGLQGWIPIAQKEQINNESSEVQAGPSRCPPLVSAESSQNRLDPAFLQGSETPTEAYIHLTDLGAASGFEFDPMTSEYFDYSKYYASHHPPLTDLTIFTAEEQACMEDYADSRTENKGSQEENQEDGTELISHKDPRSLNQESPVLKPEPESELVSP